MNNLSKAVTLLADKGVADKAVPFAYWLQGYSKPYDCGIGFNAETTAVWFDIAARHEINKSSIETSIYRLRGLPKEGFFYFQKAGFILQDILDAAGAALI